MTMTRIGFDVVPPFTVFFSRRPGMKCHLQVCFSTRLIAGSILSGQSHSWGFLVIVDNLILSLLFENKTDNIKNGLDRELFK